MKGKRLNHHSKSCRYGYNKFSQTARNISFCLFLSIFFAGCHFFNDGICEKYRNLRLDLACYWEGGSNPWELYEVSPEIVFPLYELMMQGLKSGSDCVRKEDRIVKSTLLMVAAFYGDIDGMLDLLEDGLPIDETTDITTYVPIIKFAIHRGGESALHFAARGGKKEAYDFLVRHGANEFLENAHGEMPIECWGKIPQKKYGEGITVGEDGHLLYKYNQARVINENGHLDQKESHLYEEWKEQQNKAVEQSPVPPSNKLKS